MCLKSIVNLELRVCLAAVIVVRIGPHESSFQDNEFVWEALPSSASCVNTLFVP